MRCYSAVISFIASRTADAGISASHCSLLATAPGLIRFPLARALALYALAFLALAVLRLMMSSYVVGVCTGMSAGFSPFRMRST